MTSTHAADERVQKEEVRFYTTRGEYGCFSNFYWKKIDGKVQFVIDGKAYKTVEHFFQSQKPTDPKRQEEIRNATSPGQAATMGRARKDTTLRPNWNRLRNKVMLVGCMAKFSQNPHLAEKLLATGDKVIIEHTRKDAYWGDGGDGSGRNELGKTLMEVRAAIRAERSLQ